MLLLKAYVTSPNKKQCSGVKPHIAVTRYTAWNLDQKRQLPEVRRCNHERPGQPILDMSRPATDNRGRQATLSILVTRP